MLMDESKILIPLMQCISPVRRGMGAANPGDHLQALDVRSGHEPHGGRWGSRIPGSATAVHKGPPHG